MTTLAILPAPGHGSACPSRARTHWWSWLSPSGSGGVTGHGPGVTPPVSGNPLKSLACYGVADETGLRLRAHARARGIVGYIVYIDTYNRKASDISGLPCNGGRDGGHGAVTWLSRLFSGLAFIRSAGVLRSRGAENRAKPVRARVRLAVRRAGRLGGLVSGRCRGGCGAENELAGAGFGGRSGGPACVMFGKSEACGNPRATGTENGRVGASIAWRTGHGVAKMPLSAPPGGRHRGAGCPRRLPRAAGGPGREKNSRKIGRGHGVAGWPLRSEGAGRGA